MTCCAPLSCLSYGRCSFLSIFLRSDSRERGCFAQLSLGSGHAELPCMDARPRAACWARGEVTRGCSGLGDRMCLAGRAVWGSGFSCSSNGRTPGGPDACRAGGQGGRGAGVAKAEQTWGLSLTLLPLSHSTDVFICTSPMRTYKYCPYEKVRCAASSHLDPMGCG